MAPCWNWCVVTEWQSPCLSPENPSLAWQEAMLVALKSLMPACLFNIVGFGSTFKTVFASSQIYNEVRRETVWAWVGDWQGQAEAGGGHSI